MSTPIIHIEKVKLSYSNKVLILDNLNLSLNKGELILVIGENGSGKSTLLKAINGLLQYSSGSIKVENKELSKWNRGELAKKICYVASKENTNLRMSVFEFVSFGRYPYSNWLAKLSIEDEAIVNKSLIQCEIEYLKDKQVNEISDGEKQKVFLARAMAQQTEVVVLDEPTTHLDIKNTNTILNLLKKQNQEGKSIIFSSHQVEKAVKIADKIWLVDCGRVIETTSSEFLNNKELKAIIFGEEGVNVF